MDNVRPHNLSKPPFNVIEAVKVIIHGDDMDQESMKATLRLGLAAVSTPDDYRFLRKQVEVRDQGNDHRPIRIGRASDIACNAIRQRLGTQHRNCKFVGSAKNAQRNA